MPGFEIVDVSPDNLRPLFRTLTECGKRYPHIRNPQAFAETIHRLTEPPASLQMPVPGRTEFANSVLSAAVPFDGDMAARILRYDEGNPDPDAMWSALSRAERKRAKRLWTFALDTGLDTAPQGRPHKIDAALVLYCARVVAEGCGKPRLRFSRPFLGGGPGGPMWRVLMTALPLAELFLARAEAVPLAGKSQEIGTHAEAVADILKTARSEKFQAYCRESGLGSGATDVAEHPSTFRLALSRVRTMRPTASKIVVP